MKPLTFVIACLAPALLGSVTVYPCSCVFSRGPRKDLKRAAAVFTGEVTEVVSSGSDDYPFEVRLSVEQYWKGANRSESVIVSDMGMNTCPGHVFTVGNRYLVYAYSKTVDSRVHTNPASRRSERR